MNTFSRILVPVDGSPQSIVAFRAAIYFAKKFKSHLTTLHVDEKNNSSKNNHSLKDELAKEAEGYDYHYMHKPGVVHKEIIAASKETNAELIVMGTHGISGFQEFWMGSNAHKVVTSATCPLLTMREDSRINEFRKIVLPIDTSFETRQKVPATVTLAKKFNSTVHILGVSVDKDKDAEYKVNAYSRQAAHTLEENGVPCVIEKRLGGNITNNTITYASEIDADMIMIMTEQELQIGSFFLGKFAQQMVNHSPIPVMSIQPREDIITTDARL